MSLTPTGRGMNVTGCQFTPEGGAAILITGVKSVSANQNATAISAGADGDLIDSIAGVNQIAPEITVELNKPFIMDATAAGVHGVLEYTVNDFYNAAATGGGGVTYTISNAIYIPGDQKHTHRDFSTKTLTFKTFAPDGVTNPIAYAAV